MSVQGGREMLAAGRSSSDWVSWEGSLAVTATTPHHTSQSSQAVGPPSHFSGEFRICRNNSETHTHTNNELYLIYLILSDQVSNNYYNHYQWLLNIISFIGFYWIRFHWNHRYRHTDRVIYRNESIIGVCFMVMVQWALPEFVWKQNCWLELAAAGEDVSSIGTCCGLVWPRVLDCGASAAPRQAGTLKC